MTTNTRSPGTSERVTDPSGPEAGPLAIRHALVPLDGSALAGKAIDIALDLASECDTQVDLLRVIEENRRGPVDPLDWQEERSDARAYLQSVASRFEEHGVRVRVRTSDGAAAEEILRVGREIGADLIVLATHGAGRATQWPMGSTARKVLDRATSSVLLVPTEWPSAVKRGRKVLVPVDCSQRSECVLPFATLLASGEHGSIMLAQVAPIPEMSTRTRLSDEEHELVERFTRRNLSQARTYLAGLSDRVRYDVPRVEVRSLASSSPAASLLKLADEAEADLLVLSAHGHGNDASCRFGSVASQLLARPRRPTLVVMDNSASRQASQWASAPPSFNGAQPARAHS